MSIRLKVYDNGDHACLVWLPDDGKPISDCRGFSIRRVSKEQLRGSAPQAAHSVSSVTAPKNKK
jgi:hypothetical protein